MTEGSFIRESQVMEMRKKLGLDEMANQNDESKSLFNSVRS